jgi:hypothetical protein
MIRRKDERSMKPKHHRHVSQQLYVITWVHCGVRWFKCKKSNVSHDLESARKWSRRSEAIKACFSHQEVISLKEAEMLCQL